MRFVRASERERLRFKIQEHEGYTGLFTREQSPQAKHKNGSRIVKVKTASSDSNPIGTTGTVLGSIDNPERPELGVGYFVEWDNYPRAAVFIAGWKLGAPH